MNYTNKLVEGEYTWLYYNIPRKMSTRIAVRTDDLESCTIEELLAMHPRLAKLEKQFLELTKEQEIRSIPPTIVDEYKRKGVAAFFTEAMTNISWHVLMKLGSDSMLEYKKAEVNVSYDLYDGTVIVTTVIRRKHG